MLVPVCGAHEVSAAVPLSLRAKVSQTLYKFRLVECWCFLKFQEISAYLFVCILFCLLVGWDFLVDVC